MGSKNMKYYTMVLLSVAYLFNSHTVIIEGSATV